MTIADVEHKRLQNRYNLPPLQQRLDFWNPAIVVPLDSNLRFPELLRQLLLDARFMNTGFDSTSHISGDQQVPVVGKTNGISGGLFLQSLLSNLRQGVIIIDANCRVLLWNQSVADMTGVSADQAVGTKAKPSLINLANRQGERIPEEQCPFARCISTGAELKSEFRLVGRSGREVKAELTIVPVTDDQRLVQGAVILIYDESIQVDLKRQLRDLHVASTTDPLTHVTNRAEFERVLEQYVKTHLSNNTPCSLIVADIDFFKSINDNYGHHVGDIALTEFARHLTNYVRNNDVVARYGGEEFVILCADCDDSSAMQRAEQIRLELNQTPQQVLDGKCLTASFGVSQLQSGDTPTDFFVRADKALLKAKELGRNRVVEASSIGEETQMLEVETPPAPGLNWKRIHGRVISSNEYMTTTPMPVLLQKLGGYIREVEGEITKVDTNHTTFKLIQKGLNDPSKKGRFIVDIQLHEVEKKDPRDTSKTILNITFRAQKSGIFSRNAEELHDYALREIRRYLTLSDLDSEFKIDAAATESGRD